MTRTLDRRGAVVVMAIIVAGGSWATFALASHSNLRDPNDTTGTMDVARVQTAGSVRPRWRIVTFARWRAADIFDSGWGLVRLDTFGSPRFDYYALVRSTGNRLRASLWRDRAKKPDYRVRRIQVWRLDRRSFNLRVPLDRMRVGNNRLVYRWQTETLFTSSECPNVCFDFVPDEGAVTEPIPFPSPTDTPTPTPTPTPIPSL